MLAGLGPWVGKVSRASVDDSARKHRWGRQWANRQGIQPLPADCAQFYNGARV